MKSTHPITYQYDFDGHVIEVTRRHLYTAYAANGNVHNPTEYFTWDATADGARATTVAPTRLVAYEYARAKILGIPYRYDEGAAHRYENVRTWTVVQREMRANYVRRVDHVDEEEVSA